MKAFVLDCSVTMAWCFDDEFSSYAAAVQDRLSNHRAFVPAIWVFEVANVLAVGERRGRMTQDDSARFLALLGRLPIEISPVETGGGIAPILDSARTSGLSCYDAAYLDMARRFGMPLATLDRKLPEAAATVGVARFDPTASVGPEEAMFP